MNVTVSKVIYIKNIYIYIYILYIYIHTNTEKKKCIESSLFFLHCHLYYCINFWREAFLGVGLVFGANLEREATMTERCDSFCLAFSWSECSSSLFLFFTLPPPVISLCPLPSVFLHLLQLQFLTGCCTAVFILSWMHFIHLLHGKAWLSQRWLLVHIMGEKGEGCGWTNFHAS